PFHLLVSKTYFTVDGQRRTVDSMPIKSSA
ncbi:MAG: hypothetical protein ACJAVF_002544, partial [Paraglaciecola sp.]